MKHLCPCLFLLALPAPAPAQAPPATLDDVVALLRAGPKKAVGLTPDQVAALTDVVRSHYQQFRRLRAAYPYGDQDREGEEIRARVMREWGGVEHDTVRKALAVLDARQLQVLRAMGPATSRPGELPGVVEPFHFAPAYLDKLALTQDQWRAFPRVTPWKLPAVSDTTLAGREKLAGEIHQWWDARNLQVRNSLTLEQQLLFDRLGLERRGKPHLRAVANLQAGPFLLGELAEPKLQVETLGCLVRLIRDGRPDPDFLPHPARFCVLHHAFSPRGLYLATGATQFPAGRRGPRENEEGLVRIWEVSSGKLLAEQPTGGEGVAPAFVDETLFIVNAPLHLP